MRGVPQFSKAGMGRVNSEQEETEVTEKDQIWLVFSGFLCFLLLNLNWSLRWQ